MIIRKYGEFPAVYTADIGEVVLARLSVGDPWGRAVVVRVMRRREGALRLTVVWLDGPRKGARLPVLQVQGGPELVRRVPRGR